MSLEHLKPFQRATVKHALQRLRDPKGSRRFLVADEVGLGKTLVAQGIVDGLCVPGEQLKVFYICSSLSIAHQNRDSLLEMLPEDEREAARVEVDRLTLLPTTRPKRDSGFVLYTLTPGTMPLASFFGRVDERAVLAVLLQDLLELRRNAAMLNPLQGPVSDDTWNRERDRAQDRLIGVTEAFRAAFKTALCQQFGLPSAARYATVAEAIGARLQDAKGPAVRSLRIALSVAALRFLRPDLIIFDEFQRFFELLAPDANESSEEGASDIDYDRDGSQLLQQILEPPVDEDHRPAVLLLSATPYRLYGDLQTGDPAAHHTEFFKLVAFLNGRAAGSIVERLKADFGEYGRLLQRAPVGSKEVFAVQQRLQMSLMKVMARTERSDVSRAPLDLEMDVQPRHFVPEGRDIAVFKHLRDSTEPQHRHMVEPFWSSIPYPLQTMDAKYVLRRAAQLAPVNKPVRENAIRRPWIRRYLKLGHPHPRLRELLNDVPPELLSLPWMPPTAPWWKLGPPFQGAVERLGADGISKVLLFSRFRAVPRALASVLSYEAERFAFAKECQRARGIAPEHYDYSARSGRYGTGDEPSSTYGIRQPRPALAFSVSKGPEAGLPLVLDFFPAPGLAALGDPTQYLAAGVEPTLDALCRAVQQRLENELGRSNSGTNRRPLWRWVRALEKRAGHLDALGKGWTQALGEAAEGAQGELIDFFLSNESTPGRPPTEVESKELAQIALLSPGNVLWRAVSRVFGTTGDLLSRLKHVTRTSVGSLRTYLDTPEFQLLLPGKSYRAAVRQSVWSGNLESVLDEYLTTLAGLGERAIRPGRENRALDHLEAALALRTSSIDVQALTQEGESFKLRCHAALPLGLNPSEVVSETGKVRTDFLRVAFNSRFRPFVLATTSIGQEGLDFHNYCAHLVHWDLPYNPIDLEQREGRVRRFGGLAVRRAIADVPLRFGEGASPWRTLALRQNEDAGGLMPWWTHPMAKLRTTTYFAHFSEMQEQLDRNRSAVALYRMTLGQSDQAHLARALKRRLEEAGPEQREELVKWMRAAAIRLSPYLNVGDGQRADAGATRFHDTGVPGGGL